MVFVSAFCLGGRLAEEGWRIVRSVRPATALKLPSRPKKIAGMSMATTCHENVSMGSQFIDMSRRQQCRWAQNFRLPTASKHADVARMPRHAASLRLVSGAPAPTRSVRPTALLAGLSVTMQPGGSFPGPGFCLFRRNSIAILPSSSVNSSKRNSK